MIERTLDMQFDELIIGANLSALCHSYIHKVPVIFTKQSLPIKFDMHGKWKENLELYRNLSLALPLANFMPFSNLASSIRLENDNLLKVATNNGFVANVKFNKLLVYDDSSISGIPAPISKTSNLNWIVDWFDINTGGYHDLELIVSEDKFVSKIHFYTSTRVPYTGKDAASVSLIEDKHLQEFEFSQTASRIKTRKMMKESGINGKWDKQKGKHKLVAITSNKREVHPLGVNIYEDLPGNILMPHQLKTSQEILLEDKKSNQNLEIIMEKYGFTT
jgi:hypothetical protein